jgi:ADP-ribose pyrophosphatase YjhB (NUDIX family)
MKQRYRVFLNDKVITIYEDDKIPENGSNCMAIDYTDTPSLANAYGRFCQDAECLSLNINANGKFTEACSAFNSMFKRIEAAGGIVRNRIREYLFIKRLGVWDLPKGKLHKKEPVEKGALREVREETGLKGLLITKDLPSTFHIYKNKKGIEVLKETYWFEMKCHIDQKPVPQAEENITEVKWFSFNDLNIPMQHTYASLHDLLENYLQI